MSWLPGFRFDIFISYARVDNSTADDDAEKSGWVARFQRHLDVALSKKIGHVNTVALWRDTRRIAGNQLFDRTIQDAIQDSAIFVALTSTGYLQSEYCRQELQSFFRKAQEETAGLAVGDSYRIFNVLLNNVPPSSWPNEYGRVLGFEFHDASTPDDDGDAVETTTDRFRAQLRTLAEAIHKTLIRLRERTPTPQPKSAGSAKEFVVYVADTADTLTSVRKRIVNDLQDVSGVRVAARVPPPFEVMAHDDAVRAAVTTAGLSVHLLDAIPGREVVDREHSFYPQRQAELALAHGTSQLILMPQGAIPIATDNEGYATFVEQLENGPRGHQASYRLQRELPSAMTRQILASIEQLTAREVSSTDLPNATLLDTHVKDQLHAFELKEYLRTRNIETLINPQEDDPVRNNRLFTDRLRRAGILIIFYGSVPWQWVQDRLRIALQIAVAEGCPLRACGVYMAPPLKLDGTPNFSLPLVSLEWMDHTHGFNSGAVDRLLARAQVGGGTS